MEEEKKSNLWVDVNIGRDSFSDSEEFSTESEKLEHLYSKLKTGDMLLCHGYNPKGLDPGLDGLIEFATHSPWEHAAIVIRDPWWLTDSKGQPLTGLYVYQSGSGPNGYPDIINGNVCGVTLNRMYDFLANRQHIYVRSIENVSWTPNMKTKFVEAFNESHGKPYDKNCCEWLCTGIDSFFCCKLCRCFVPKRTNRFWCSALVAWMYESVNWINPKIDWSALTPADLALIEAADPYSLSDLWLLYK